jgi:hypothetical protein
MQYGRPVVSAYSQSVAHLSGCPAAVDRDHATTSVGTGPENFVEHLDLPPPARFEVWRTVDAHFADERNRTDQVL